MQIIIKTAKEIYYNSILAFGLMERELYKVKWTLGSTWVEIIELRVCGRLIFGSG